jgi:DNA-binding NtrC family response regulator
MALRGETQSLSVRIKKHVWQVASRPKNRIRSAPQADARTSVRQFKRVRSQKRSDLRIISASNRNLKQDVLAGSFREVLYYRLADVTISLPALREVPQSVVPLALRFLRETCSDLGDDLPYLDQQACDYLAAMPWPGNIRQLKSVMRRAALNAGSCIGAADFALRLSDATVAPRPTADRRNSAPPPFPCAMDNLETWSLEQALSYCGGKRMKTAAMLGMNYYTFRRRLEKHGIAIKEEP